MSGKNKKELKKSVNCSSALQTFSEDFAENTFQRRRYVVHSADLDNERATLATSRHRNGEN